MVLAFFAVLLLFFTTQLAPASAQGVDGSCPSTAQPVVTRLAPPSGTTGSDPRQSTNYTVTGDLLDRVATISVSYGRVVLRTEDRTGNSTAIGFHIQDAFLRRFDVVNATLSLFPIDTDCLVVNVTFTIFSELVIQFPTSTQAQPGSVIFVLGSSCVPGECGDNSTTFDFIIGGITLERLSTEITTLKYVGRFPNFQGSTTGAEVMIVTQYQAFRLPIFITFNLFVTQPITGVVPNVGQRGTSVAISGPNLLGRGLAVTISRVRLGENDADIIDDSNSGMIRVRAGSGSPGTVNIRINTTDTFQNVMYDGPYTFLENGWTQLMDGNIVDIVPPAAQLGRNILLCGNSLLGGGSSVSTVQHGPNTFMQLQSTPSPSIAPLPGMECLEAQIPQMLQSVNDNNVVITSNTGATVSSISKFSVAAIESVSPRQGQVNTIVTIRGRGLLSGYSSSMPTVFLSNVLAILLQGSNTEIIVRAGTPPVLLPQVINATTGATVPPPQIIGVMGNIVIQVMNPFNNSLMFNVSNGSGWQYEESGTINAVFPIFGQYGTVVTITGSNLLAYGSALTHAMVGSINATILDGATNSMIQIIVPDFRGTGIVDITLFSNTGATVRGSSVFQYRERGVVLNALPSRGQNGTVVTIIGTNLFGHGQNVTSVLFGGTPGTIDYSTANNTMIGVRVQANNNTADTAISIRIIANTSAIVTSSSAIWTFLVQGQINSNQPQEGQAGTLITINGANLLGGGEFIDEIFLDGVSGIVLSNSSTRIEIVMDDLLTQRANFFPGQIYIMSNRGAVVFGGIYMHRASGVITSLSPVRGRRGTIVTIMGTNVLGFGTSLSGVEIAGVQSSVTSFNNTAVIIRAGMGRTNQTGPVVLRINTGAIITSLRNFTYDEPGVVSNVFPTLGAEGTGILVRGTGLLPTNVQLTNVTVGGIPVSRVVTASNQEVSIIVGPAPPNNSNNAMIVITASDGSFVDGIFFTFINLSLSLPGLSRGQEGTIVEVTLPTDSQFDPNSNLRATVDDLPASILSVNQAQRRISVSIPRARRQGMFSADVAVEGTNGLIARLRDSFTYLAEGIICGVQPTMGQQGTNITLLGENLLGGGSVITSASVVGQPAMVLLSENIMVVLRLMSGGSIASYPQQGDIILTADTSAVVRRLNTFSLVAPGNITRVSPPAGQNGTRIEIRGTNLIQGNLSIASVTLAGIPAAVLGTPTDILITVQAATSSLTPPSSVVIVLSTGATISSANTSIFRYLAPGQMTLSPNVGTVGTRVRISGTNLLQGGVAASVVTLGGVGATVTSSSDSSIDVTVQTGVPGIGDVVIVSDTGSTLTGTGLWTYEALGSISSVTPMVGQQDFVVTITGVSLLGSASGYSVCTLAGVPGSIVPGGFSNTALQCRVGMNPSSRMETTGPIQVMTNTGVLLDGGPSLTFTYYAAYIDTISPTLGNNGTFVTITGLNLFTTPDLTFQLSRVLFGSTEAMVVNSSLNEIRVRVGSSSSATNGVLVRVESTSGSFVELQNAWVYTTPRLIFSVMPQIGLPGDTVLLSGDNLIPTGGVVTVRVILGQTEAFDARVVNATAIEFRAGVYQNSNISGDPLPVQIIYSTGETIFNSSILFTYNESTSGIVNSINPLAGSENSIVIISGTDLPNMTDILSVTLANVQATVLSSSPDEIMVEAGPPPSSGVRGQVIIETNDGNYLGLAGDAWEYYPVITSSQVSPLTGQNGTIVVIDLSPISNPPAVTAVNLTSVPATDIRFVNGTLTVRAGSSPSTSLGDITIEFAGNIVVTIPTAWSYQAPVSVSQVTPSSGYFNTSVSIQGSGFQASSVTITAVYLAGIEASIESQSDTVLMVRVSQESSTRSDVVGPIIILADSGAFYMSGQQRSFTYIGVQVNSITPLSGTRGTLVTLTGVSLLAGGTNITSVTVAGVPATVQSMNSTVVSFVAGASASSSNLRNITYTLNTDARVEIQNTWRYIDPGAITSVTPLAGAMGTIVSISGDGLLGGGSQVIEVRLNSQVTMNILESFDNFIQVIAAGATGPLQPGSIQVISDTQAITESDSQVQFTYLQPGTFTSFTPNRGQNGTMVTILGQRLHNGEGVGRVLLAGIETTIRGVQDAGTATTVVVEAGRSSDSGRFEGPVAVFSNSNTTTISALNFTYVAEGGIFSVAPSRGRNGTVVSIQGENLYGGGASLQNIVLAGEVATNIINQTTTEVFVSAPLSSDNNDNSFTGDIILVSDTNAHVIRVDGWTYVQRGVVRSVVPAQGQYGTRVTINGQNLLSGGNSISSLQFDNVLLDVLSANDTSVMARVGQPASMFTDTSESISLTSDFGSVLYYEFSWTFLNQSNITSLVPPDGFGGQNVTVSGINLLGGGNRILSVSVAGIMGRVVSGSGSDSEVVIATGTNTNGVRRMGDLILESDTGAMTTFVWTYNGECPSNMFGTVGNCLACDIQCAGCTGPSDLECTSCENFSIYNSTSLQCVEECPSVSTLENVCVDACETYQFERINTLQNLTFCHNCSSLCDPNLSCTGPEPSQCRGCLFFEDVVNQTCIDSCPSDTFYINETKECRPCHPQCSGGCRGPSDAECFGCANLRVNANAIFTDSSPLFNDVCRVTCPSMFFLDLTNNYCIPCDSSCSVGCSGPSPFDCDECSDVSLVYANGSRMCLPSCNATSVQYYEDTNNICQLCNSLCLPGAGCRGPEPSDCNDCSLSQDSVCVSECIDSTYFIRSTTRTCVKCDEACGNGGCTESGPLNCLKQGSLSAGPGTIAFVIIVVLILVGIIVVLVIVLVWKLKGSRFKYKFHFRSKITKDNDTETRYTSKSKVQDIPLNSIEEQKIMSNPLFVEEGGNAFYTEAGPEGFELESTGLEVLYSDADTKDNQLPEKNSVVSASQDLYADMDLPPSFPEIPQVTASQDLLYTDMELILPEKEAKAVPTLPPKPAEQEEEGKSQPQTQKPPLPDKDQLPPIPAKPEKPPPPEPPAEVKASTGPELYTDMQGGITEVFINTGADDVYDDVEVSNYTPSHFSPPAESPIAESTYEDTDNALASMEQYRKSFGAGLKSSVPILPGEPARKSLSSNKRQSAPALPSQPIPKKRSSNPPLPATPLQKSLSLSSTVSSPVSPTSSTFSRPTSSTFSRPQSVTSDGGGIPEEESLYDDISTIQPLVKPAPAKPSIPQPQKKQPKAKSKKK